MSVIERFMAQSSPTHRGAGDHRRRPETLPPWIVETLNTLNWSPSSDSFSIELGPTRLRCGSLLRKVGFNSQAIQLDERVTAGYERILGTDHPDTLTARANLATSYRSAGRTNDAIALEEQVVTDREHILGTNHPDTLTARGNLATSYWSAGRTNDAIELMEQVVASAPDVLGADHPHTALFLQALEHLRNET